MAAWRDGVPRQALLGAFAGGTLMMLAIAAAARYLVSTGSTSEESIYKVLNLKCRVARAPPRESRPMRPTAGQRLADIGNLPFPS